MILEFYTDGNYWADVYGTSRTTTFPIVQCLQTETAMSGWWQRRGSSLFPCSQDTNSDFAASGIVYVGDYYPAISYRDGRGNDWAQIVSTTKTPCYHCAMVAANAWVLANPAPRTVAVAVCSWAQNGVAPTLSHQYLNLLPERSTDGQAYADTSTIKSMTLGYGCNNCGFPGHNSRTCTTTKHYDKVGIEIEGRWIDLQSALNRGNALGANSCEDGSILRSPHNRDYARREFQTKPGNLTLALRQLKELYPDEADNSCGLHVHVSFNDETYISQLACKEFYAYFEARWLIWAQRENINPGGIFMARLEGRNDYCAKNCETEHPFHEDRYKQLNFSAWGEHKTVECRLLPMFRSSELAKSAVIELLSIYEDWLSKDFPEASLPSLEMPGESLKQEDGQISSRFDVDTTFAEPISEQLSLAIPDLPPVANGFRRIAGSQARISVLREIGLVA